MKLALQPVDKPRKRGALKRIVRALTFPVDEMLPKSKLQRMKKLLSQK